ncbi:MAG TPA: ATP-binding protein, partial [Streptosporangiaceae bacterium]
MTAIATRRFPATSASVGQARRFLLGQLPASAQGEDADELVLMLSELSTNAVQHAATDFEVAVYLATDGSRIRVEVSDGALGFPAPPEQVPDAPHGRGLHIVRALADTWGIEMRREQPGKTVWFSLPLSAPEDHGPDGDPGAPGDRDQTHRDEASPGATPAPAPEPVGATAMAGAAAGSGATDANEPAWPVPGVRVVLDGLRDAVVATDDQGTIRYVNRSAEDLLG